MVIPLHYFKFKTYQTKENNRKFNSYINKRIKQNINIVIMK